MKIVLFLMNYKGYKVLSDFLSEYGAQAIEYIVTSHDENVKKDYYDEIANLCKLNKIQVFNRTDNLPDFQGYKVAIGWRWLIEGASNLVVMHDSILPRYRGFSPLVNMLINGEKELGVTALFASNKYDEGDVISQSKIVIEYPIKIEEAIIKVSDLYSELIISIYKKMIKEGKLSCVSQDHQKATYSLWRDESDYLIDWSKDASTIERTINALSYPYLGAKTYLNDEIISIYEAEEVSDVEIENRDLGKIIFIEDGFPFVVCGQGLLKIKTACDIDNKSILPIKKFRSRFGAK